MREWDVAAKCYSGLVYIVVCYGGIFGCDVQPIFANSSRLQKKKIPFHAIWVDAGLVFFGGAFFGVTEGALLCCR